MKFLPLSLFLWTLAIGSSVGAQPTKPKPGDTHWPGITATVYQIIRLPENRVSIQFIYEAKAGAPAETYIADRPMKGFYTEGNGSFADQVEPKPYTIETGKLVDESSGQSFSSAALKPQDQADPGWREVLQLMRPGDTFFIGGVFSCPPINQDDPPKEQKVTFELPGFKKPIKNVPLPREEYVPLNFFPAPQMLAPRSEVKDDKPTQPVTPP